MRIVVVDDDRWVRESLRRSLEFNGYTVELAEDGVQALDAVTKQRPDAMVLDMTMPRLDGLEVCRQLRSAGDNLPVLVLTARDAVADRVAGLDAGADDYLPKPFVLEELLARLRALLRRRLSVDMPRDPGAAVTFVDNNPSAHKADSPSPSIEAFPYDAERSTQTQNHPAKRRIHSKSRLATTILGVASVIVAAIGLIPPFAGAFWAREAPDPKTGNPVPQSCIKFSDVNGVPSAVVHKAARVETRSSAWEYPYWLVLALTLADGNVITTERPIRQNSDKLIFPLNFLAEDGKHHILIVNVDIASATGGPMGSCS